MPGRQENSHFSRRVLSQLSALGPCHPAGSSGYPGNPKISIFQKCPESVWFESPGSRLKIASIVFILPCSASRRSRSTHGATKLLSMSTIRSGSRGSPRQLIFDDGDALWAAPCASKVSLRSASVALRKMSPT